MTTLACAHRFILASPDGPTGEGRCTYCGETRWFSNSLEGCLRDKGLAQYGKGYHHVPQGEVSEEVKQLMITRQWGNNE